MIENGQYKIVIQPHAKGAILPRRWGNALRHKTIEQTKSPTTIHTLIFRIMRLSATSLPYRDMSHFAQTHPVKNNTRPVQPGFCFESRKPKMQAVPSNQSLKCSIQGNNEKLRGIGPKWYVRPSQHLHNLYCLPSELGNYITA